MMSRVLKSLARMVLQLHTVADVLGAILQIRHDPFAHGELAKPAVSTVASCCTQRDSLGTWEDACGTRATAAFKPLHLLHACRCCAGSRPSQYLYFAYSLFMTSYM